MFKHSASPLLGAVVVSLLAGCSYSALPVVGSEGQATARAAFEQLQSAIESGDQDTLWNGLSVRSQTRIKDDARKKGTGEKEEAIERARQILGQKSKIKEVFGTIVGIEYPQGKYRELEMVLEDKGWKLNLFSS
jgi:hypothetical protein